MYILAFDTSFYKTYISLGNDEKMIASKEISDGSEKMHSAFLVKGIIDILKENNLTPKDISLIGVGIGPASFTGIRIASVVARVMAQELNINIVPVSSLEIFSNVIKQTTSVLFDARKNKIYAAKYDENGNEIDTPHLIDIENTEEYSKDTFIIGDKKVCEILPKANDFSNYNNKINELLYKKTYDKYKQNKAIHWALCKPMYIQKPSITISKKSGVSNAL